MKAGIRKLMPVSLMCKSFPTSLKQLFDASAAGDFVRRRRLNRG